MFDVRQERDEIERLRDDCEKAEETGSRFPGMTYEQGILAALRWVNGEDTTWPLE
jgi:hypothetical protein